MKKTRVSITLTPKEVEALDAWRKSNSNVIEITRSAAVRWMVRQNIGQPTEEVAA